MSRLIVPQGLWEHEAEEEASPVNSQHKKEFIMQSTITHDISQPRFDATYATEKYLRYNGARLCDLLDALDDKSGFEAFCDLHSILAP
ncbi:hypothetical protein [Celeribacter sp.]|uniref:hypothetical protein n=1 Tax=Celeribacter sp. TaxID=1890673 RepID=UPI003A8D8ABD